MKKISCLLILLSFLQVKSQDFTNTNGYYFDTISGDVPVKDMIYLKSGDEIVTSNFTVTKKNKLTYIKDGESSINYLDKHKNNLERIALFSLPQIGEEVFYSSVINLEDVGNEKLLEDIKGSFFAKLDFLGSFKDEAGEVYVFDAEKNLSLNLLDKISIRKKLEKTTLKVLFKVYLTIKQSKVLIQIKDIALRHNYDGARASFLGFSDYYIPVEKLQTLIYLNEKNINLEYGLKSEYYESYLVSKNYQSHKKSIVEWGPKNSRQKTLMIQNQYSTENLKTIANYFNAVNKNFKTKNPNAEIKVVVCKKDAPLESRLQNISDGIKLLHHEMFGEDEYPTSLDSITPYTTFVTMQIVNNKELNDKLKIQDLFHNESKIIRNKTHYKPLIPKRYDISWQMMGYFKTGGANTDFFSFEKLHQLEIFSVKKHIESQGISKDILSQLVGRSDDGSFSMDYLINISREVMDSKGFIENKDLQIDRTVEDIGIKLMLNSYIVAYEPFIEYMSGVKRPKCRIYVYKLDISREDLTNYAMQYWTEGDDLNKIDKYKFLKVPVKYVDHAEIEILNNDILYTLSRFPKIFKEKK